MSDQTPPPNPPANPPTPPAPPPPPAPPAPPEPEKFSREYVHELREEAKGWRQKADGHKGEAEAARRERDEAKAEAQRVKDQAQADANARVIRAEIKAHAIKAGMVDLDGLKLFDLSPITLGEDGEVKIPDGFFDKAKEAKPYLFGAPPPPNSGNPTPPPNPKPPTGKKATEMTDEEYRAARTRRDWRK